MGRDGRKVVSPMEEKMEYRIYTCGKMSGKAFEYIVAWRGKLEHEVSLRTDGRNRVVWVHPPCYYNYEEQNHKSEREIFLWELNHVRTCNIFVVNLEDVETSVGSLMELGAAVGANLCGANISIIGIGDEKKIKYPWIKEACLRIEDNIKDAAEFIAGYLLI